MKRCTKCGVEYPETATYFVYDKRRSSLQQPCRRCCNESSRNWRINNPEAEKASKRKWVAEHPEYARDWARKNRVRTKERRTELSRKRYAENPEKYRARSKKWLAEHPEYGVLASNIRRARVRGVGGSYTREQILNLNELQKGKCWWCGKKFKNGKHHADHRIALSRGGSNDISNIVLACPKCNLRKHDKLPHEFNGRLL